MSVIRVTPEQLQTMSGRVASGAGSIDAELQGLRSMLAPLGSEWAGTAQTRFVTLWEEWQRSARSLNDVLQQISGLLNQAGLSYAQAEQAIAGSFSR